MQLSITQSIIRWSSALLRCCCCCECAALVVGGGWAYIVHVHCEVVLPGWTALLRPGPTLSQSPSPRPVPFTVHCSFTARSLHSSVRFVRSFVHSFIHSFVRSFVVVPSFFHCWIPLLLPSSFSFLLCSLLGCCLWLTVMMS